MSELPSNQRSQARKNLFRDTTVPETFDDNCYRPQMDNLNQISDGDGNYLSVEQFSTPPNFDLEADLHELLMPQAVANASRDHQFRIPTSQPGPSSSRGRRGRRESRDGGSGASGRNEARPPSRRSISPTDQFEGGLDEIEDDEHEATKSRIFTEFFRKIPKLNEEGQRITGAFNAQCNYCDKTYKFKKGGGYGTYTRHAKGVHADKWGISQQQTQMRPSSSASGGTTSNLFSYNAMVSRNEVVDYICTEGLALQMSESLNLQHCVQTAWQPAFKKISRTTIRRDMQKAYKRRMREIIRIFDGLTHDVNLCGDIWSDEGQHNHYMGISCHWVDNDWNMQKRLIAYRAFNERHTARNITRMISKILDEYGLRKKIFSISFDNASNNDLSITELKQICQPIYGGTFFHIRCLCHVLNLCVTDAMQVLNSSIGAIKDACQFINARPNLVKRWNVWCHKHGSRPYRLPTYTRTRWNSSYDLLKKTRRYKDIFVSFAAEHCEGQVNLYASHWTDCDMLMEMLEPFKEATLFFSSCYKPTSHAVLPMTVELVSIFENFQAYPELVPCLGAIRKKWNKYMLEIPELYLIAVILDPRIKTEGLHDLLESYYEFLFIDLPSRPIDHRDVVRSTIAKFTDLYAFYDIRYGVADARVPTNAGTSSSTFRGGKVSALKKVMEKLTAKRPRASSLSSCEEIDKYLTTTFEIDITADYHFEWDILKWWKSHSREFPVLSHMAMEILSCPVSTVTVERAFSIGGNMLTSRRATMHPRHLEYQMCNNDWVLAERRTQDFIPAEEDDQDVVDTDAVTTGTTASTRNSEEDDNMQDSD